MKYDKQIFLLWLTTNAKTLSLSTLLAALLYTGYSKFGALSLLPSHIYFAL